MVASFRAARDHGRYYARHDGEVDAVPTQSKSTTAALAGDSLPASMVAPASRWRQARCAVGLFGIGERHGDKDRLRSAARRWACCGC